ncbi:MAG TPA: hypothetical protein VGM20_12885 [Gemmatimonadales bacterium]|jgi:hypothetical protein
MSGAIRRGGLLALLLSAHIGGAAAQAVASDTNAAFDRADREAQTFVSTMRCAEQGAKARKAGLFGPADSLGAIGECLFKGGHRIAIFMDVDSQFTRVTHLAAVDLTSNTRVAPPPDTSALVSLARAELPAELRGMGAFEAANRQFAPLSFRSGGDTIEVWLVPISVITGSPFSVGGEWGFVYSPDGRTLVREVNRTSEFRSIAVADTGIVRITSRQTVVPTLSELVVPNLLNGIGRDVSIELGLRTSLLTGRGSQAMWIQLQHKHP